MLALKSDAQGSVRKYKLFWSKIMDNNSTNSESGVIVRKSPAKAERVEQAEVRIISKPQKEMALTQGNNAQPRCSQMEPAQLIASRLEKANSVPQSYQTKRKKRRSKAEMESLTQHILIILKADYSLSSVPYILGQRKDNIGNRVMDEVILNQLGNFSQTKKIVPCTSALCKLLGLPESSFIEITCAPNGGILIVGASVAEIRNRLGISA